MLTSGGLVVVWRGLRPQLVLNPLGAAVVELLRAGVDVDQLGDDLSAVGVVDRRDAPAALAGLRLRLTAAGVECHGTPDPGDETNIVTADALFLSPVLAPSATTSTSPITLAGQLGAAVGRRRSIELMRSREDGGLSLISAGPVRLVTTEADPEAMDRAALAARTACCPDASGPAVASVFRRCRTALVTPMWAALWMPETEARLRDVGVTHTIDEVRVGGDRSKDLSILVRRTAESGFTLRATDAGGWQSSPLTDLGDVGSQEGSLFGGELERCSLWRDVYAASRPASNVDSGVSYASHFEARCRGLLGGAVARSVKVRPGELDTDRMLWLLDDDAHAHLGASAAWLRLLHDLDAPPILRTIRPTDASELRLGFERAAGATSVKLYLSSPRARLWDALRRASAFGDGVPEVVAVKWDPERRGGWRIAAYRMTDPEESRPIDPDGSPFPDGSWRWAEALAALAQTDVRYLAMNDSDGRRSVDMPAALGALTDELAPVVTWLGSVASLSRSDVGRLVRFVSSGRVDRAIGGTAADGSSFVSLYHRAERRR